MNENVLEIFALKWFESIGWEVFFGPDIMINGDNPLRESDRDILLIPHFREALWQLNPYFSEFIREEVFVEVHQRIKRDESLDLIENNRNFHRYLIEGIPIRYKNQEDQWVDDRVFLIDFNHKANNRFAVVNQFSIRGSKGVLCLDIVVFINGLPIAIIEFKGFLNEQNTIQDAFNQLQNYKIELSNLLCCNEALIIFDGLKARVGSLTADFEGFRPWRVIKNENDHPPVEHELETLVRGFFDQNRLLDYLQNFIVFSEDGKKIAKIIAGYHQFHAVQTAIDKTVYVSDPNRDDGKAGVVWHTQGSGKSFSMCFFAGKLLKNVAMKNPTIIIVTVRSDLERQLYGIFSSASELLKTTIVQAETRDELRHLLAEREIGGIIFATAQKFGLSDGELSQAILNDRHNIVVISDDAHRTQYGLNPTLNEAGIYTYGYAKYMQDAIPNASFICFTGTPIAVDDHDTQQVFGKYISIYDIETAVNDAVTVPIYYESRLDRLTLDETILNKLSNETKTGEDERKEDCVLREKERLHWRWLERLVSLPERLKLIANDIIIHFTERSQKTEGKAIIVVMNRAVCVALYQEIIQLKPDWHDTDPTKGAIKVIMTGSALDPPHFQSHLYSQTVRRDLEMRFRDPLDPFKIVIVCDMWLTGFDAPSCHTMYLDKPLKGQSLVQAITRVNRVFRDKEGGLIVDYIGVEREFKTVLKVYADSQGHGEPIHDIHESFSVMKNEIVNIRNLFRFNNNIGFDLSKFKEPSATLLISATNHILSLVSKNKKDKSEKLDGKSRFLEHLFIVNKAQSLCATLEESKPYREEISFYDSIRDFLELIGSDGRENRSSHNLLFSKFFEATTKEDPILDIIKNCNFGNQQIDILNQDFFDQMQSLPYQNIGVEILQKLIVSKVKANFKNNIVEESGFNERLKETLHKYYSCSIDVKPIINELIVIAKEVQLAMEKGRSVDLNDDEFTFYQILIKNELAKREMDNKILRKMAQEITKTLQESVVVDWQVRESIRAQLRILVRRILRIYKYPSDASVEAVELIIKNAELLSDRWCGEN